jgi:hypothetical protein
VATYSYKTYISDGSERNHSFDFSYISEDYIDVTVDGYSVPFTFLNSSTIRLGTAAPVGSTIEIRRDTQKVNRIVDFQDGSILDERSLDLANQQTLDIVQEAYDYANRLDEKTREYIDRQTFPNGPLDTGVVNVKNFGAKGNGVTNDTVAIQEAINSLSPVGGSIFFPPGTYVVSALTCVTPITITGAGSKAAIIKTNAATGDTITATASGFSIRGMGFDSLVPRTSGAFVKVSNSWYGSAEDLFFSKYFIGLDITSSIGFSVSRINGLDGVGDSVVAGAALIRVGESGYCGGINIEDIVADVNDVTKQPTFGILLRHVDVATLKGVLTVHHKTGLMIAPKAGQIAALIKVDGCDFDTASWGIKVQPVTADAFVTRSTIAQTWAGANSADGVLVDGTVGTVNGLHFTGLMAISNGQIGVNVVGANAKNVTFSHCQSAGNGSNGLQVTGGANATWDGGVLGETDKAGGNVGYGCAVDETSTGSLTNTKCAGNTVAPVANNNPAAFLTSGNTPHEWATYASTITSLTGTVTAATGTLRYKRVNKTVHFSLIVNITNNGSGAGALYATLPFPLAGGTLSIASGRGTAVSAKMVQGLMDSGAPKIFMVNYDGGYPAATGETIAMSGTYEAA